MSSSERKIARAARSAVGVLCLVAAIGCGSKPSLNGDPEVLKAADALWTAVAAKRLPLVEDVSGEIERLHTAKKLSDEAHLALGAVVAAARQSQWDAARADLKRIIQAQRPKS